MRIELTVRSTGCEQDVAISAPGALPLSAVRGALADVAGARAGDLLWSGESVPAPSALLGTDGLRTGAVLTFGGPHRPPAPPAVLALHQVGGPGAGRVVPLERGRLTLGRGTDCEVVLADADVSRRHACIEVSTSGIRLRDLGSTNGTTVEGEPVDGAGVALAAGQLIRLGDCALALAGPTGTPAAVTGAADGTVRLLRPPRRPAPPAPVEIELPVRSAMARPRGVQWVTALLPAAAGGAIAWVTDSPQFMLFALLSPLMMISSSLGDRLHWRRSRRTDAAGFARRRAAAEQQVTDALHAETAARRAAALDPAALLRLAAVRGSRLWERRRTDADLLDVRLGLADLPSQVCTRQGATAGPAGTVLGVPFTIGLHDGPLGLCGPRAVAVGAARCVLGQLALLHSPADVGLSLLLTAGTAEDWHWARWLPHLAHRVAVTDDERAALVSELASTVQQRRPARNPGGEWRGPWHVLVLDRAGELADVPGLPALLAEGAAVGVTAVCVDSRLTALPAACRAVVRISGETGSRARVRRAGGRPDELVVLDSVPCTWADEVARRLAPLVDPGQDGAAALPASCGLLETLGLRADRSADGRADDLDGGDGGDGGDGAAGSGDGTGADTPLADRLRLRWAASDGGAATELGHAADGPLRLDLVADGPHALVAGTTGSGKSELLQALVAGLAANHPPDELSFLLIDYKGGAAFGDCAALPHTAGLVTDLNPYLTERALRSLDSELRRRERLFADVAAPDLAAYRRVPGVEPLSRLVLVVDEFATLADELPTFVRGLVGVAQRGRSLGVHLVLATQRPGSAVSPEIRANTSIRIALRVTDAGESSDILDAPAAAAIERGRPGRAYLRAGETLTAFQTAYPHAVTAGRTAPRVRVLGPWRRASGPDRDDGPGELAVLVQAVRDAARAGDVPPARRPWLDPLPELLPRSALPSASGPVVGWGLADLPDEQRREPLTLDLGRGPSLLVAGAGRSGRTGLVAGVLAGAATQLPPDRLAVYLIDPAGALVAAAGGLPHVATAVGPDDAAGAITLLRRLERACAERTSGPDPAAAPLDLLVLDGWDRLVATLGDSDAVECADLLAGLLRTGPAAGLTVLVTGDRSVLAPRLAGGFDARVLLRLADRSDYGMAGVAARAVPAELPPGRGVRAVDGAVVQMAYPGAAPGPAALVDEAARIAAGWRGVRARPDAVRLRPLPRVVPLSELGGPPPGRAGVLALGLGGDRAEPVHVDLFAGAGRLLVAGPPRSGRSTVLRCLLTQALAAGVPVVVAASRRSPLGVLAREQSLRIVDPADPATTVGDVPDRRTVLLVDDCEHFTDSPAGERLAEWVRAADAPLAAVVAGRADDLATSYRGLGAQVRRSNCGLLLRPGPVDGEILGVRLRRRTAAGPPGRGVLVGDPQWGAAFADGEPVPVQVAQP